VNSRNAANSFGGKFAQLYRECFDLKQTISAGTPPIAT